MNVLVTGLITGLWVKVLVRDSHVDLQGCDVARGDLEIRMVVGSAKSVGVL